MQSRCSSLSLALVAAAALHVALAFFGFDEDGNNGRLDCLYKVGEAGLRLRYELRREFAPYIGVTWNRSHGRTADYARNDGEPDNGARLVLGLRMWF